MILSHRAIVIPAGELGEVAPWSVPALAPHPGDHPPRLDPAPTPATAGRRGNARQTQDAPPSTTADGEETRP